MWSKKEIMQGDCFDILKTLPDNSFDSIIIDPPYGMNVTNKRGISNDWDKILTEEQLDILFKEFKRLMINCVVIFGSFKTCNNYFKAAFDNNFVLDEHIVWVKRSVTPNNKYRATRRHENIFIFKKKNTRVNYYNITGKFEDLWPTLVMDKILSIQTFVRYHNSLTREGNKMLQTKRKKRDEFRSNEAYRRFDRYRNRPRVVTNIMNYSTVWSFLSSYFVINRNVKLEHATIKPYMLIRRLIEFVTPKHGAVLDCFAGSCGIALACEDINTNYLCIEKDKHHIDFYYKRREAHLINKEVLKDSSKSWVAYLKKLETVINNEDFELGDDEIIDANITEIPINYDASYDAKDELF